MRRTGSASRNAAEWGGRRRRGVGHHEELTTHVPIGCVDTRNKAGGARPALLTVLAGRLSLTEAGWALVAA